jgi:hydroxymethylbilane synthase
MPEHLILGTRGSKLALTQSNWVRDRLQERHADLGISVEIVETHGDRTAGSLRSFGGQGVFTAELEQALLERRIDLAVHSLKDLPTRLHEDLDLVAIPAREDVRDILIGCRFESLPQGARLGTGSLRRRAQLSALRPDLTFHEIRGNIDTRIRKLKEGECDALVLAAAALHRLGWHSKISSYLEVGQMLPAVGQGALALQMRRDDARASRVTAIQDSASSAAVSAERSLLLHLGGGCQTPIAGWGRFSGSELVLTGLVAEVDGTRVIRTEERTTGDAADLGRIVAERLQAQGATGILEGTR